MKEMDKEIVRMEEELNDLRENYKKKRDLLPRIIQKLI